jgi:Tol biopolymer transport system component
MDRLRAWLLVSAGMAAGAAAWFFTRADTASQQAVRLQALAPPTAAYAVDASARDIALSPDGSRLVYVGTGLRQLYARSLNHNEPALLQGTANARGPFFSPDGEWVGFFQGDELKKTPSVGGMVTTVCRCGARNVGAAWLPDGTIVFTEAGGTTGLRRIAVAGGEASTLAAPDHARGEQAYILPEVLGDGRALLFAIVGGDGLDGARVAIRDSKSGEQRTLVGGGQAHYLPSGHLVFNAAGTMHAVPFDIARMTLAGPAVPVVRDVITKVNGTADFVVSRNGAAAYMTRDIRSPGYTLVWFDRQGRSEATGAPPHIYLSARMSPDGARVALADGNPESGILMWDFMERVLTQLTFDPGTYFGPVWSPDGSRMAFGYPREGAVTNIYWQATDGTGAAERLLESTLPQHPWTFTSDGKSLIIRESTPETGLDLSIVPLEGERKARPLVREPGNQLHPDISPDGRWIAYQTEEAGASQVVVRPFPSVDSGKWIVSPDGGTRPRWNRRGGELFYQDPDGRLLSVTVQTGTEFKFNAPAVVFDGRFVTAAPLDRTYDVSPDGNRFLAIRDAADTGGGPPVQLNVILNWAEELKVFVPRGK